MADFNEDGMPDIAVAHWIPERLSILFGTGDGRFGSPILVPLEAIRTEHLAAADLNGDGHQDLVLADSQHDEVVILLGNGDGSFQQARRFRVGDYPTFIAVGDFNKDGRADLVVANYFGTTVSVLLGADATMFEAPIDYQTGSQPRWIVLGDYDGDGQTDLAVANHQGGTVSILKGSATGTFEVSATLQVAGPASIAQADFNGDGRVDLAVASLVTAESDTVVIFYGTALGTFADGSSVFVGPGPAMVIAQDFDGDGIQDLAVANRWSNYISLLPGRGGGNFDAAERYDTFNGAASLVVADLDLDGKPDLLTSGGRGIWVMLSRLPYARGHGSQSFVCQPVFEFFYWPLREAAAKP